MLRQPFNSSLLRASSETLRHGDDGRVDANYATEGIHQRAAGIAGIQRRGVLDHVVWRITFRDWQMSSRFAIAYYSKGISVHGDAFSCLEHKWLGMPHPQLLECNVHQANRPLSLL